MEEEDSSSPTEERASRMARRLADRLARRRELTAELHQSPYDLILYLERAVLHSNLGYPELAAGDAYRALLLTDEIRAEDEYHDQAVAALEKYEGADLPDVLDYGTLSEGSVNMVNGFGPQGPEPHLELAAVASIRCYQILSLSLLLCKCLRSAYTFCERGLKSAPNNQELLNTKGYIENVARQTLGEDSFSIDKLTDANGMARREVYPWNTHEPDRLSDETLAFLNKELASVAPKCEVRVSELPVLLEGADKDTDSMEIIPTCRQLGLFAKEDIAAGERVLYEYSPLTVSNRLEDATTCDACSSELPSLKDDAASRVVECPECYDATFCDSTCFDKAMALYHPAVCGKPLDAFAKDPAAAEVSESLYLLLLARLLAMAATQDTHPLALPEIRYIWGDFLPSHLNALGLAQTAEPPADWTLPFSFEFNIKAPLHVLEKMDVDIFASLARHDLWVVNTLYAKFRGTASARKTRRDGRPDVAAVHPLWCLANHDCNPNVTWDWGGRMQLWALETRVVGGGPGGVKKGEEIFNHYCDLQLPVHKRREWAKGALGGWCMCRRCRDEAAAAAAAASSSSKTLVNEGAEVVRVDGKEGL